MQSKARTISFVSTFLKLKVGRAVIGEKRYLELVHEKRSARQIKKIDAVQSLYGWLSLLVQIHCTSRNFGAIRRIRTLVNFLLTVLRLVHRVEKYQSNTSVKRGVRNIFKGEARKCPLE